MSSLELIKRLVQFNTVSRDSNLPLIDFIFEYLDDLGIRSYRVESDKGKKSYLYVSLGPEEIEGVCSVVTPMLFPLMVEIGTRTLSAQK